MSPLPFHNRIEREHGDEDKGHMLPQELPEQQKMSLLC